MTTCNCRVQIYNNISSFLLYVLIPYYIALLIIYPMTALMKIKQTFTYTLQIYNNISSFLLYVLILCYMALLICGELVYGNGRKSLLSRSGCASC